MKRIAWTLWALVGLVLLIRNPLSAGARSTTLDPTSGDTVRYQSATKPKGTISKIEAATLLAYDRNLSEGNVLFPYILLRFAGPFGPESVYLTEDATINGTLLNSCRRGATSIESTFGICDHLPNGIDAALPVRVKVEIWDTDIWGRSVIATDSIVVVKNG